MRSLADTIERLSRQRTTTHYVPEPASRLTRLQEPAVNPGQLAGWYRTPEDAAMSPALVVVLHGCTQSASSYDHGSGWSRLADDYGFAVLFPEQSRKNNPNLCFNWFQQEDVTRDLGEVLSIRQMIDTMITDHGIDQRRIFVTGLSAGGAMANALLASYPEVFAGGAIIAGLPFGVASTVSEAFDRMRGHGLPSSGTLEAGLRAASKHEGPWPTVSVWHGTADNMVLEANARAIVDQWRGVHQTDREPDRVQVTDRYVLEIWRDRSGRDAIEHYEVSGMGHGTPVDVASGYGHAAAHMLDVGISSTVHVARAWGLTPSFERKQSTAKTDTPSLDEVTHQRKPVKSMAIQDVIEDALRSAGLMK
jgi:poly(hydroxyalkanoate) depolymerase family esterase